ncbi:MULTISPECIES: hypothetical protein [unclassified Lysinibacillus]|uniref:hypothetical protein n=1 Tax=unclassified Lysinibacillus TaxID=2636778 RepID=UPI0020111424|nr:MULTISPECIES: hypothetical protein [unclassified Lysinibacillus]MCL1695927.1 hypothetical protein [Lysinibacillus sp. BPa_S21]MCL1700894.1 hypothetical protein [Lysinibacillus sp. Bpr_S20]
MRALVLTAIIIIFAFVAKVDLTEGSLHLAAFYPKNKENALCEKQREPNYITVQTIQGDTIHSLFALHPAKVPMTFPERLQLFYELNPHLQLQALVPGENIKLPLSFEFENKCGN